MSGFILECDLGNTHCNWRLLERGAVVKRGVATHGDNFAGLVLEGEVGRVRVASVAKEDVFEALLSALAALGIKPEIAATQREVAGVRNAYGANYSRLGVDRWLAVVAAYQRVGGAVLVLDAGSALTADLVDGAGVHLGGYIIPGAGLMASSLLGETGRVRFDGVVGVDEVGPDMLEFGCTTEQAVSAGVMAAQCGASRVAVEQAKRRIPQGFAILVTGGAGAGLMASLPQWAEQVPELVLDGLAWVVP